MNFGNKRRLNAQSEVNHGTLCERVQEHLLLDNGVKSECRIDTEGRLHIKVADYSDWLIARLAANTKFGIKIVVREE